MDDRWKEDVKNEYKWGFGCYKEMEECRRLSVTGCFKYYQSSTRDPTTVNCAKRQIPSVRGVYRHMVLQGLQLPYMSSFTVQS